MADPRMPQPIIDWMEARNWGMHHAEWHFERQWDRQNVNSISWAISQGWSRAARQEGEVGNGLEFLIMHRAMIELVRENFPAHANLVSGWSNVPTDPDSPSDPVPPNGQPRVFDSNMLLALRSLSSQSFLAGFASDDQFGLYIETNWRPVPGNPQARSSDPSTGLHNYVHRRFSDPTSDVDMGKPLVNLGNEIFWRLHGWIDSRWTAYRQAKGLPAEDSTLRGLIDAEKDHLRMSHMHHASMSARASFSLANAAASSQTAMPQSATKPFEETLQKRFSAFMDKAQPPQTIEELRECVQMAIELEWFTLPPYLTAYWSIKSDTSQGAIVSSTLRDIAIQEMLHMSIACNLLVAIGGKPQMNSAERYPSYPDYPPGIALSQTVQLQSASLDAIKLFMEIEKPSHEPIHIPVIAAALSMPVPTIGDFYNLIVQGLDLVNPTFNTAGQLTHPWMSELTVIDSLASAKLAIKTIVDQGEGTSTTPTQGNLDQLAHYYMFQQILDGMEYVKQPDNTYAKDPGKPITFPAAGDIQQLAPVPPNGYPGVYESERFDTVYTAMMTMLHVAWDTGNSQSLVEAVDSMGGLSNAARELMEIDAPTGNGKMGPAFLYRPIDAEPIEAAVSAAAPQLSLRSPLGLQEAAFMPQSLCETVGNGCVGECGSTTLLTRTVPAGTSKVVVLRNIDTSLCPNQGVVGVIIVNGRPVASGDLTQKGSSIQASTVAGSQVVALANMIPLFNNISCFRLGDCQVALIECELEAVDNTPNTRNWTAWNNTFPPGPSSFHLFGEVEVDPRAELILTARNPQGINPRILLLDLVIVAPTSGGGGTPIYKSVRYDRYGLTYDAAQVWADDVVIANVDATPIS